MGRIGTSGRGDTVGKGGRRVSTVQKYVHMYISEKMIPVDTVLGMEREGDKGEWWRGECKYDIFDTL
jgi:hypothetical protein